MYFNGIKLFLQEGIQKLKIENFFIIIIVYCYYLSNQDKVSIFKVTLITQ